MWPSCPAGPSAANPGPAAFIASRKIIKNLLSPSPLPCYKCQGMYELLLDLTHSVAAASSHTPAAGWDTGQLQPVSEEGADERGLLW
jgi:hypothetical protein